MIKYVVSATKNLIYYVEHWVNQKHWKFIWLKPVSHELLETKSKFKILFAGVALISPFTYLLVFVLYLVC